ncbi:MAG: nuclear transport factor 2 family protein [Novosphingobium sp.]|nr:nuclear transport factor 2 family protein [Novosphingobium sp.]
MMRRALFAGMALAVATAGAGGTHAMEAPMIIAGGELDPAYYQGADVYLATPRPPDVPPVRACKLAESYIALVNAGEYAAVAALYADNATFLEPMRKTLRGREEIEAFYTGQIGSMKPILAAVSYLGNDRECMVEIALQTEIGGEPRFVLVSIDHFILGADGKIVSMTAFGRPPRKVE